MKRRVAKSRARRAITLAEVVVSTLLVGLLMVGALSSVGAAARSWTAAADTIDGHALAAQLLTEVTAQRYEDPDQTPDYGPETGETAAPGVRAGLDDTDDYNDWNDSPPKDRSGAALAGYTGWSRTADVQKLNTGSLSTLPDSASDKGLRLVTVAVTSPAGRTTRLQAFRSTAGGTLQPQGVDQTLVTWAGVALQAGNGPGVSGGVSLINHAADQ